MKNVRSRMRGLIGRSAARFRWHQARIFALLATGLLAVPATALSAIVELKFEGIADGAGIGNYYSGVGVEFSPGAKALIDSDAGGSGNFENEPSPSTIMAILGSGDGTVTLNFEAGFTDISFYYTALADGAFSIFEGIDGDGAVVDGSDLFTNSFGCLGGVLDAACVFQKVSAGGFLARSIVFYGQDELFGFDSFEITSAAAPVPLPAAAWLLLSGLAGLGFFGRRRATAN